MTKIAVLDDYLNVALRSADCGIGGIFYPDSEFLTYSDVGVLIGQRRHLKGLIDNSAPTTDLSGGWWGSNVRMISTNGTRLTGCGF